jgi:hypothetical protein
LQRGAAIFVNLNDEAYDDFAGGSGAINPLSVEALQNTLTQLYPTKSRFET